jgi:hypothetical protein
VPEKPLTLPEYASYRGAVHRLRAIERGADAKPPPLRETAVRGGASVLRDQSACPFRGLALHRLGADGLEAPHAGLDARERGTLVHRTLAGIWAQLKTRDALDAMPPAGLEALLAKAAEDAVARSGRASGSRSSSAAARLPCSRPRTSAASRPAGSRWRRASIAWTRPATAGAS